MPIHRFQTADGKIHRVEAPTREAAEAELGRVLEIDPKARPAYERGRAAGGRHVTGWDQTFAANIPFMDEFKAGGQALIDTASGKGSLPENWRSERAYQEGAKASYAEQHPIAANSAKGIAFDVQAIPAFFTGGASAAPNLFRASAEKGALAATKRLAAGAGRNAAVGGAVAAGNAFAGRGSLAERTAAAGEAIPAGAAVGVAAPAVIEAPGAIGSSVGRVARATGADRFAARAANKAVVTAGRAPILDPQEQALARLGETLKADKFTPDEIRAAMAEWTRVGGPSPALMDLVSQGGRGQRTMSLIRGAAMKGGGRAVASEYGNDVAVNLQDNAIARTRQLTTDGRTVPAVEADVQGRIVANSQAPEVQPGRGGAMVSANLNRGYDAAKSGVDQAYGAARAANGEQAQLPKGELPQLAANVRESVRDFHPQDIPSVSRELDSLDKLNAPTIRDLYEMRQRLSAVRQSQPQQAVAARRAISALDDQIGSAIDRGVVTGDPQVVGLWRTAIGQRRAMGQQYQGGDLIQNLTAREPRAGGMANAVAPEDASNAILGRNGLSPRMDLTRDLTRLRETVGADSAEWTTLRREALGRVLGRDAGTENFGQHFAQFERDNPELAQLLITPQERAGLAANRQNIGGAVADRTGLAAGRSVLTSTPDAYAAEAATAGRPEMTQLGAARTLEDAIGRPAENSTGVLNRIGTATNPRRNLEATFGEQPAGDYRQAINQMRDQLNNARFINPNTGAQTAGRLADETLVENIPTSKLSLLKWAVDKVRGGVSLTDAEREAIVQIATSRGTSIPTVENVFKPRLSPPEVQQPSFPNYFALPRQDQENRR